MLIYARLDAAQLLLVVLQRTHCPEVLREILTTQVLHETLDQSPNHRFWIVGRRRHSVVTLERAVRMVLSTARGHPLRKILVA
eukprot:6930659-Pyramimonas_sp.AAC.1